MVNREAKFLRFSVHGSQFTFSHVV